MNRDGLSLRRSVTACLLVSAFGCACSEAADTTVVATERLVDAPSGVTEPDMMAEDFPIVFTSNRGGGYQGLFLMSVEGGGRDAVPVALDGEFYVPRWKPGGTSIAFRQVVEGVEGVNAEVGLMTPDGAERVLLTQGEAGAAFGHGPHWSPDGEQISFGSIQQDGERVLTVSPLGGTPQRLLPDLQVEHREAAWSPDGTRVAYNATTGRRGQRDLFVAEVANPEAAVNLTRGRVYGPGFLRWSPDGAHIAFSSAAVLPDGSPEPGGQETDGYMVPDDEVFVLEVETGVLTRLTDNVELDLVPAWSPDGRYVLFTSTRDGDPDLWLMPFDATEEARNLIDDNDDRYSDSLADWYWGER